MVDNEKETRIFGSLTPSEAGKKGNKRTERKRKVMSFVKRIWCNSTCRFFPCWAEPLSRSKYGGKCALKEFPKHTQKRTLDFYIKGRKGIEKRLIDLITFLSTEYDRNPADKEKAKELINELIKVGKFLYGEKMEITDKRTLTYGDVKKAYEKAFGSIDKGEED